MKCKFRKIKGVKFFILERSSDGEMFSLMKIAKDPDHLKLDSRFLEKPLFLPLLMPMVEIVGIIENLKLDRRGLTC